MSKLEYIIFHKSLLLLYGLLNLHVVAFFDVSALKEVPYFIRYLCNNSEFNKVIAKFQNKAAVYHIC